MLGYLVDLVDAVSECAGVVYAAAWVVVVGGLAGWYVVGPWVTSGW